ncbi:MAG TPA: hypothetical protein VGX23_37515 [Actinocrinis sp.]|nr:hypothetical protein [Actinocrinis sp.]
MNADSANRSGAGRPAPGGVSADGWGRAAAYDAYADGLHTYALWSLRDHDAAVDALYCAFVIADRNVTQLRQPDLIQPWLYAILRRECAARASGDPSGPAPVSGRRPGPHPVAELGGSLDQLERSLRRAELHSLEWAEAEGLVPVHREILELTIRHGLDSRGLGLVLGLNQSGGRDPSAAPGARPGSGFGGSGGGPSGGRGFGVVADAWRELERSLAAVAVARSLREAETGPAHCAQLAELIFGWSGRLDAVLRGPLTDHVDRCARCQKYLHSVVGRPAAPSILPFVAAPRSLRELLLGELADPEAAARQGVDHREIAARAARFTPEGFPALADPQQARRTTHRRQGGRAAAPVRPAERGPEAETDVAGPSGGGSGAAPEAATTTKASAVWLEAFDASAAELGRAANRPGAADVVGREPDEAGRPGAGVTGGGKAVRSSSEASAEANVFGTDATAPVAARPVAAADGLPPSSGVAAAAAATSGEQPSRRPAQTVGAASQPLLLRKPVPPGPPLNVINPAPTSELTRPQGARPDAAERHRDDGGGEHGRLPDAGPAHPAGNGLYRAPGSWADRVLPDRIDEDDVDTVETQFPRRVFAQDDLPGGRFVDTPSGRFAALAPDPPPSPAGSDTPTAPAASPTGPTSLINSVNPTAPAAKPAADPHPTSVLPAVDPLAAAPAPRFNEPVQPRPADQGSYRSVDGGRRRGPDPSLRGAPDPAPRYGDPAIRRPVEPSDRPAGGPAGNPAVGTRRARHKSKPVRQAVLSAVAIGAVGAVAAASAVVLGLTSSEHTTQALDGSQADPLVTTGSGVGDGGLPVQVGPSAGDSASATAPGAGTAAGAPAPGLSGSVITQPSARSGSGSGSAGGAGAAVFFVSVNQRDGDPDSVSILLRNTGKTPLAWSAKPQTSWITLSQSSGTIPAGGSATVTALASAAAPAGQWTSQVDFTPGNQVLVLHGGIPTASPAPPTSPPDTPPTSAPPSSTGPAAPPTDPPTDPPTSAPPTDQPTDTPTSASSSAAPTASGSESAPTPAPSRRTPPKHKK